MKVGTKSVLFGAHCFLLHPIFVAIAWIKLYGFPFDPRIWVAFFVHDLGYIGKPNMDGPEGETHVKLGARIMGFLFDLYPGTIRFWLWSINMKLYIWRIKHGSLVFLNPKSRIPNYSTKWSDFSLYHSRYYAKKHNVLPSKLCIADKLSFCVTPRWLYLPMVNATGEIKEYLKMAQMSETKHWQPVQGQINWHKQLYKYMEGWVNAHKDGGSDEWTNSNRHDKHS